MKLTKYEKIMLWVIAIVERIKDGFLRFYPTLAIGFSILYTIGFAAKHSRNLTTMDDLSITVVIAIIITILTLVYIILFLREKLREARLKRWIR